MLAGVLNVDKGRGDTSFSVVRRLRQLTGAHRVGHAGTLDPLATGVLPILFESATRLSSYALDLPKTYAAVVNFGFTTATDDSEGELVPVADPSALTPERVERALTRFVGRIRQTPPAYSAVKIEGERSYRRARRGEAPAPAAREVEVYSAAMLDFEPGAQARARILVTCGSGTYLRSLARDLGLDLGVGGYLGALVRTAYGPLRVEDAIRIDDLTDRAAVESALLPPQAILPEMEGVRLTVDQEALVRQGRPVRVLPVPGAGPLRAMNGEGRLVALGRADLLNGQFVPDKVLS